MRRITLKVDCSTYERSYGGTVEHVPVAEIRAALVYIGAVLDAMPQQTVETKIGGVHVVMRAIPEEGKEVT